MGMFSRLQQTDKNESDRDKSASGHVPPTPPESVAEIPKELRPASPAIKQKGQKVKSDAQEKQASKQEMNIACNIAIFQSDMEDLRVPAYKAQTFRFTEEELDRLKDEAYSFSRLLKKKVGQGDLLRLGLLLFKKLEQEDAEAIAELLKRI